MRRKKSYKTRKKSAIKKNKEIIRKYKKKLNLLEFCGDINIKITCIKCRKIIVFRTHHPELVTEEVRKNFVCLLCEGRKR